MIYMEMAVNVTLNYSNQQPTMIMVIVIVLQFTLINLY